MVEAVLAGLAAHRHLDREKALLAIDENLNNGEQRPSTRMLEAPLQQQAAGQELLCCCNARDDA